MNNKIPINKLVERMAAEGGVDNPESLPLIKDLFAAIEEEVSLGGKVVIPGLGSFTKSHQPGEPIAFTADPEFADVVNEPFALFSPAELNDEVTDEMLHQVGEDGEEKPEKPEEPEQPEEPVSAEPAAEAEVTAQDEVAETDEPAVEIETEAAEEPAEEPSEVPVEEVVEEEVEVMAADEEEPKKEVVEEQPEESESTEYATLYDEPVKKSSKFWAGLIIGFLLGFALGVIAFLGYLVNYLSIPVENIFPLL